MKAKKNQTYEKADLASLRVVASVMSPMLIHWKQGELSPEQLKRTKMLEGAVQAVEVLLLAKER